MHLSVFGKSFNEDALPYISNFFEQLHQLNLSFNVYEPYYQYLVKRKINPYTQEVFLNSVDLDRTDMMICVGGDGTLLEAITLIGRKNIPIMGINAGRLGFLATTPKQKISEDIVLMLNNRYTIEERTLIKITSDTDYFEGLNFGLNEFSILKKDSSSMIVIHAYLNDVFLNSYWSDGLIVSTPTGSTAYSLSCGGPVVMPNSSTFVITPISPHNLNVRPLVINDDSKLQFKIESRSKNYMISLDSRYKTVSSHVTITATKADFKIKLVRIAGHDFLNTLREKLFWGVDKRN